MGHHNGLINVDSLFRQTKRKTSDICSLKDKIYKIIKAVIKKIFKAQQWGKRKIIEALMIAAKNQSLNKKLQAHLIFLFLKSIP